MAITRAGLQYAMHSLLFGCCSNEDIDKPRPRDVLQTWYNARQHVHPEVRCQNRRASGIALQVREIHQDGTNGKLIRRFVALQVHA